MGRGLGGCCFTARPDSTLSFKEAADPVQRPEAGHRASSDCLADVLDLLPAERPQKDEEAPEGLSKVFPFAVPVTEEHIQAGTYLAAPAVTALETTDQLETAGLQRAAEAAEHGPQVAEQPQAEALAATDWWFTQPAGSQGTEVSLEVAEAAALAACCEPASPPGPAARCCNAAHLSPELQVAEALGDLRVALDAPAQDAAAAANADDWPVQNAAGAEGGLVRSGSTSSATSLSSPWRTSTSSFAAEAEASKRFSCCGFASPVLETIQESISTQEPSFASLSAASISPAPGATDGGTTIPAASEPAAQPAHFASVHAQTADIGGEVATLLGCATSGPAPTTAADQTPLADILALLGQVAGSPSQVATADPSGPTLESFSAEVDQLLQAGPSVEAAAPAETATNGPGPAVPIMAGQLASLSQDGEAGWEAEVHSAPGGLWPDPAAPADEAADWMQACGGSGGRPAEEASNGEEIVDCTAPVVSWPAGSLWTAGQPHARAPPSWSSDGGECADPLAAMHDRAQRQRREAEQRRAQQRLQQEADERATCTFRPKLHSDERSHSRPGNIALLATAGSGHRFGEAAGSAMYARQQAQRQRQLDRLAAQRAEQERETLEPCTFRPVVDAKSQRMFANGVRYGGSRLVAGGPSMDAAVHRQLRLLHSAGLNAETAAAVLASQALVTAGAEHAEAEVTALAGQPGQAAEGEPMHVRPGDLSGASIPAVLQQAAASPARRQLSTASSTAGALLSPAVAGRPVSASARLYAHAVNLQGRQRQAPALWEQKHQAELLAASPKAKPFPRAQHTNPPSPPLSRRSPPVSRPGSAPPPGLVCGALEQAAAELTVTEMGAEHPAAGRGLQLSTTTRPATYWQRWGLGAGADFEGFLQRQEKFVQALGAKLEAERQLPAAQQAAAATPGAHLSPGSRRLLQRRQEHKLAREMEAAGCMRVDAAGCLTSAEGNNGGSLTSHSSPHRPHISDGTASGTQVSKAGPSAASACASFPFRPVITARAAARPGRTPEELHAEGARRQEKLAQRRREAEQAALAPCTFVPDIAPTAGSPLSAKFAGGAKGHINLQDLGGYMQEVREKQAAREEAAATAAKARQEQELAKCTFQPNLGHRRSQRSPIKQSSSSVPTAASPTPGGGMDASAGPAAKMSCPPDVLAQVQALLRGGSTAEPMAGDTVPAGHAAATGSVGAQQVLVEAEPVALRAAGAGQAGAAVNSFPAFLGQVTAELKKLQAD